MRARSISPKMRLYLERIANEVKQVFGVSFCLVSLILEDGQHVQFYEESSPELKETGTTEWKAWFCQCVVLEKKPLVIMDTQLDPGFQNHCPRVYNIRFCAGIPLIMDQHNVLGTLSIFDNKPYPFSEKDMYLLGMFGHRILSEIFQLNKRVPLARHVVQIAKSLIQSASDAIILMDHGMNIIASSAGAQLIFGYTEDEMKRENLYTIVQDMDLLQAKGDDCWNGKTVERKGVKKDGSVFPVEICLMTKNVGSKVYFGGIIRDITNRNEDEKRLKENNKRLSSIVERAGIGIAVLDMNGNTVECNKALADFLGYNKDELKNIYVADTTHPDDLEKDYRLYRELIEQKRNAYQIEKRYYHKDRHIVWGRLTLSLIFDEDGQPLNAISMVEDITERKELERQLINSEKFSAIGKLAAGLAHEIRNPLTSIIGFFKLLSQNKNIEEFNKYSGLIEKELDAVRDLVSDFVLMTKPSLPEKKLCAIHESIRETILFMRNQTILEKNTEITFSYDSKSKVFVYLDPLQIKQVLINLFQNALEAIPYDGWIHIHTYVQTEKNTLSIVIEDNGTGIGEDELNQIMNPFFTTKENGTGLGLSICYRIIENHGGNITVTSQKGVGTRFEVFLPMNRPTRY